MRKQNVIGTVVVVALLLLVPLVGMRFGSGWDWSPSDFIAAAVLLLGTGLLFELASSRAKNLAHRAAFGTAIAGALLLVWINLAVGMIGDEDNPANLMYLGVLGILFLGSALARFQPQGMARALFATALAQVSVGVIALVAGWGPVLPLDFCFAALWAGSGLLFRQGVNATLMQPSALRSNIR